MLKSFLIIILMITLGACGLTQTRPKYEMSLATAAFLAAKEAKAISLAPNLYRKAETYFLKARSAYKNKYFNKAKQYALLSKHFSEKAEYNAIRKSTLEDMK